MSTLEVVEPHTEELEALAFEDAASEAPPAKASPARDVVIVIATGCTVFGLLIVGYVVYLIGVTRLEHDRSQRALVETYNTLLARQQAPIGGPIPEGLPVGMLEMPEIGVREAIVEGTTGSQLAKGPGHLRSSPLPGQPGNAVIMCRRVSYGGPCLHIDQLEKGDEIKVLTGQGRATYVVTKRGNVAKGDDDVLANTSDNTLTLVSSNAWRADHRYVVQLDLKSAAFDAVPGRTTELRTSELGLHRDGTSVLALLCWLQLLVVAAIATVFLRRRWSLAMTMLVAIPVFALLLLCVFDSFTPLLPSTL